MTMTKKALLASVLAAGAMVVGMSTANAATVIIPAPGPDDLVVGVLPGVNFISYTSGDAVLQSGGGSVVLTDGQWVVVDGTGTRVF